MKAYQTQSKIIFLLRLLRIDAETYHLYQLSPIPISDSRTGLHLKNSSMYPSKSYPLQIYWTLCQTLYIWSSVSTSQHNIQVHLLRNPLKITNYQLYWPKATISRYLRSIFDFSLFLFNSLWIKLQTIRLDVVSYFCFIVSISTFLLNVLVPIIPLMNVLHKIRSAFPQKYT